MPSLRSTILTKVKWQLLPTKIMEYQITIIWNQDDVRHQASQMGVTLTDEQIIAVLDHVEHNHDANFGISWDTIQWAIEAELQHAK